MSSNVCNRLKFGKIHVARKDLHVLHLIMAFNVTVPLN